MQISVEKIDPDFVLPKYHSVGSACFDLSFQTKKDDAVCYTHSNFETTTKLLSIRESNTKKVLLFMPGDRVLVPTGLKMRIETKNATQYSIRLYARSGLSLKTGLCLANGCGIIDTDYQEEIFVPLVNTSSSTVSIFLGDRIAQAEIIKNVTAVFKSTDKVMRLSERIGGFGSTGAGV